MARNRELSQYGAVVIVDDQNKNDKTYQNMSPNFL